MKSKKYTVKQKYSNVENGLAKKHYKILVALIISSAFYYYFVEPKIIGHNIRYSIYIFWLPTFIGLLTFTIYRRQLLINKFRTNKGASLRIFMSFFYLLQGFIFSYLSFGLVAKIGWDILNERAVQQSQIETFRCDVERFWTGRRPYTIDFRFEGRHESIKVNYSTLKEYRNADPKNYYLEIEAKKGIWNYYKLYNWIIIRKGQSEL